MYKNSLSLFIILSGLLFCSCKNENTKNNQIEVIKQIEDKEETVTEIKKEAVSYEYAEQTIDDELAKQIENYITTKLLTEDDLELMTEKQRIFQLYKIDLNNDGKNEVFVNFLTSYFCGTGGCTLLLLNSNLKLITRFSSTRTLFVEQTFQNNWKVIMTKSQGSWRKLIYTNGSYPSNPSVVEITTQSASSQAEIMFGNDFSKAKTYTF